MGGSKPGCDRCVDSSACDRRVLSQLGMRLCRTYVVGIMRSLSTFWFMIGSMLFSLRWFCFFESASNLRRAGFVCSVDSKRNIVVDDK